MEYELLCKLNIFAVIIDLSVKNHVNITFRIYIVEFNACHLCCYIYYTYVIIISIIVNIFVYETINM